MATAGTRRPVMTLYSRPECPDCHRVRIVLAEKSITADIIDVDTENPPEDLIDLNAYSMTPTLIDRDLVIYNAQVIMEYLDERFPHPPLMPVDPVSRARARLMLHRIETDWYAILPDITKGDGKKADKARKIILDDLLVLSPMLSKKAYFMSDEFAMLECSIAPVLWRLPQLGIDLPASAKPIQEYAERLFSRESFKASLTVQEEEFTSW